ncbi:MAG: Peptidyl-tRNA hydrolase [Holosporales bacterium]
MRLIVGLGNYESCYLLNRHNVGFILVDALWHAYNFPPFKEKFNGYISQGKINGEDCLLLKPKTYMNRSGLSVQQVLQFYKLTLDQMIVLHDDLDLIPFDIRIKKGGGAGGHNGLKSIDQQCGKDYWRFRFGIGRPALKSMVSDYVLSNFSKSEQNALSDFFDHLTANVDRILTPQVGTYPQ